MENEKKNPAPQGEKQGHKKQHHRRGYFIEPAKKSEAASPVLTQNPPKKAEPSAPKKADQPAPEKKSGDNQGSAPKGNNHRHKKRHNNRPKNDTQSQAKPQQESRQEKREPQPQKETVGEQKERKQEHRNGQRQSSHRRTADTLLPQTPKPSPKPVPAPQGDEYEEIHFPAPDQRADESLPKEEIEVPMVEVVGVRFKNSGKTYYFAPLSGTPLKKGTNVIVETARGQEFGEVTMGNSMVKESDTVPPLRPILRLATKIDREHHEANKSLEESAFRICNEKIAAHGLDMKLIDAQYTFDNTKLLFYFTSAGRVDFRELVKDLASVFRTRIELRQIGIRDEAKLMGGMGMCGRPLCCNLFLSDFGQVSIKMAKEQNLSLNSAKISGICGRLMCCLRYEHETYEYEIKRTPPVDALVRTVDGNGTVTEINPLVGTVKVRLLDSPEVAPKTYRREDVIMLQKKQSGGHEKKSETKENKGKNHQNRQKKQEKKEDDES